MKKNTKGILLIFILGIIVILSVVVFATYSIANIAQKQVILFAYQIRSQFASQSGLEFAFAKLKNSIQNHIILSIKDPFYFPGEIHQLEDWLFSDINNNGFPDTAAANLLDNVTPSFFDGLTVKNFKTNSEIPVSGISEKLQEFISFYKLKVIDLSSLIYIGEISQGTKNLLNNLSKIIDYPVNIGDLLQNRYVEKGKLKSYEDIKDIFIYPKSEILTNFFTFKGWQLSKVVYANNNPIDSKVLNSGFSFYEHTKKNISIENRAPINLNLAPPEIIKANLYNLSANILVETPNYNLDLPTNISIDEAFKIFTNPNELVKYAAKIRSKTPVILGMLKNYAIENNKIDLLVSHILRQRVIKPFVSYSDFYNFLTQIAREINLSKKDIDIIYANINPTLYFQKANLDKVVRMEVDKTDLVNQTTEFIFYSPGNFYVESAGFYMDSRTGEILSKDIRHGLVSFFDIISYKTQKDFEEGLVSFSIIGKNYKGVSIGPLLSSSNFQKEIDGFLKLGLVSNKITTDDITFCHPLEDTIPAVGSLENTNFTFFSDGIYSSGEIPLKIPLEKNFPIMDFKEIFGIPYKCDMFMGTALQDSCGKITRGTMCFWIKPNYQIANSSRVRTILAIESVNPKFQETENINYIDSFVVSFIPLSLIKDLAKQYFPHFAPHTKYFLTTPFFLWTPKINPTYLALTRSENELLAEGVWTHLCIQWDSTKNIERAEGAKIIINGEEKTFLFGNDYSTDFSRMFRYFAPAFLNAKYLVFGTDKNQLYWNFPLEATVDNIIISKKLYNIFEINDFIFHYGRYSNVTAFWQSPKITINELQKPAFIYADFLATPGVKFSVALFSSEEYKQILMPITYLLNFPHLNSFNLRIYFDVIDIQKPLLESPVFNNFLLFIFNSTSLINTISEDVLLPIKSSESTKTE